MLDLLLSLRSCGISPRTKVNCKILGLYSKYQEIQIYRIQIVSRFFRRHKRSPFSLQLCRWQRKAISVCSSVIFKRFSHTTYHVNGVSGEIKEDTTRSINLNPFPFYKLNPFLYGELMHEMIHAIIFCCLIYNSSQPCLTENSHHQKEKNDRSFCALFLFLRFLLCNSKSLLRFVPDNERKPLFQFSVLYIHSGSPTSFTTEITYSIFRAKDIFLFASDISSISLVYFDW